MENEIILYTDENGKTNVSVRFADEDVWVTQAPLAEIYNTSQQNIGFHIENIYKDNELPKESTYKDFLLVQKEGIRNVKRNIGFYLLAICLFAYSIYYFQVFCAIVFQIALIFQVLDGFSVCEV